MDRKKAAALERLKNSRASGESMLKQYKSSNSDVYEEVNEGDYENIVRHRQREGSFVVDDDAGGYVDDGSEVWDEREPAPQKRSKLPIVANNQKITELIQKGPKGLSSEVEGSAKDFLNSLFASEAPKKPKAEKTEKPPAQDTTREGTIREDSIKPADEPLHVSADLPIVSADDPPADAAATEDLGDAGEDAAIEFPPAVEGVSFSAGDEIFFWWSDCYEAPANGSLFLSGRLLVAGGALVKAIVNVPVPEKSLFFLPKSGATAEALQSEVFSLLGSAKQFVLKKKVVTKRYSFDLDDVPAQAEYLKITLPFRSVPSTIPHKGNCYSHVFGLSSTATECFLIKRKIRGPGWVRLTGATVVSDGSGCGTFSWCSRELQVPWKGIQAAASHLPEPALDIVSLDLKTVVNQSTKQHEIVAANFSFFPNLDISTSLWEAIVPAQCIRLVRPVDGVPFPVRFQEHYHGNGRVDVLKTEAILLNRIVQLFSLVDPDVVVGHNCVNFDLDVLLTRIRALKISEPWSKIGRLRLGTIPKGVGASNEFALKQAFSGRLLCDTYLSAKELVKSRVYSLHALAKSELSFNVDPTVTIDDDRTLAYYESAALLTQLIRANELDALLAMRLAFRISALLLSRELSTVAGNLWWRTLLGARAERTEFLLLHEFHAAGFVLPDRKQFHSSLRNQQDAEDDVPDPPTSGSGKRRPAYAGGLVLEPKRGLYDRYILLLDFNSLYPSLFQEYNICFTTISRSTTDPSSVMRFESSSGTAALGVLPKTLAALVSRRRQIKSLMKDPAATQSQLANWEIRQKALKLTANSMYGCLGFVHSRFYAPYLASLVTAKGREVLQGTVEIAREQCHLDVIYGDTDSVMINSDSVDLKEAQNMAMQLKRAVNERYRILEIELDGVFRKLLLLKKKKYAALVAVAQADTTAPPRYTVETKGLDLVRRDWCALSVEWSTFVLEQILSLSLGREESVERIHSFLQQQGERLRSGAVPTYLLVINRSLTKAPAEYSDPQNHPHVVVAMRLIEKGRVLKPGDTVPYIVCRGAGQSESSGGSISQRSYHPDEVEADHLVADVDWYLAQQLLPPITRLCEYIEGTDAPRLAACLGMDTSRFHHQYTEGDDQGLSSITSAALEAFRLIQKVPLPSIRCGRCGTERTLDSDALVSNCVCSSLTCAEQPPVSRVHAVVLRHIRELQSLYYSAILSCDEGGCCGFQTNSSLHQIGDYTCPQCSTGTLRLKFSERDLYLHVRYLQTLFQGSLKASLYQRIEQFLKGFLDQMSWRWVDLRKTFSFCESKNKQPV